MNWFGGIQFDDPWFLLLLLAIPLLIFLYGKRIVKRQNKIDFSHLPQSESGNFFNIIQNVLQLLPLLAFALLCLALARPQQALQEENITADGIDIVIATDVSGSMLARDFTPDRLEAAKAMGIKFVEQRKFDRIGLVVFAGESFTQCPITTDHQVVTKLFGEAKTGLMEDGTAIGMGLATAVSRLKESDAESKVIILLTDGVNNSGFIEPLTAAETAKQFNIKVYTIGVGTQGTAPFPQRTIFGKTRYVDMKVEIDEELLLQIAEKTNGKYFRATNNNSLESIYKEIDELEKTEIDVTRVKRYSEKFHPFAKWALALLLIPLLLNLTFLKKLI